jgi:hexosaminidase
MKFESQFFRRLFTSVFVVVIFASLINGQNYALQFTNSTDVVNINRDDVAGSWTVEFWVKKTATSSYSTAIDGQSGKIDIETWGQGGKVGITKKGVADWAFNYVVPTGVWTHLAFVCDGSKISLFANGTFVEEMSNVISMPIQALGQSGESGKMILDEIRFWTVAKTEEEIAAGMNVSADVDGEGLSGYYYLDNQATTATDISPTHINGEIVGAVYTENDNVDFTTTLKDMDVSSVTAENFNEYFSKPGAANQDILRINILTEGVINPISFNSATVTLNGTDNITDITSVKVYYSEDKSVFSPDNLVETAKSPVSGEISFAEDIELNPGNNYFWLVYDVTASAKNDNKIDGTLSTVVVKSKSYSPETTSPAGYRVIKNDIPSLPAKRDAVIPKPQSMTIDTTQQFVFSSTTKIVVSTATAHEGDNLSLFLQKATGYPFEVSTTEPAEGNISLEILAAYNDQIGDEGYLLTSNASGVKIEANSVEGIFYGTQTLRQLLPTDIESADVIAGKTWDVAYVDITDYPKYSWRGLHFDVSRHFFSADFVKKYIDIMAVNKLNRFHWHLTDDQGWRIEIKSRPELMSVSAWRTCNGVTYGGYYTQDEIADVIAYATERHVMVIPEIEMPGHTSEVLAAYPELSCATSTDPHGGPFEVRCAWGVSANILCAGKEETFTFIEDVLTEVCDLFPSPYIHLGGDEAPKSMWEQCPDCQARIAAEGLANEEELQRYFMERAGAFLATKNKKWIGWSEITYGGVPDNATVMSWLGESSAITAAQQGHDAVLSPYWVLYLDAPNSDDPDEPDAIGYAPNTLEKIYFYDPMPSSLNEDEQQYILGPQSCLWTEYISDEDHAEYMILPRIFSLAEIGWYGNSNDFTEFESRVYTKFNRLDYMGYNYRPLDFPEDILPKEIEICDDSVVLELNIPADSYYWNDAERSTGNSIVVRNSGTFKCFVDYLGEIMPIATTVTFKNEISKPEVGITATSWIARGDAESYLWYDKNDNLVFKGLNYTPPDGADPNDYMISGVNKVNKKSSVSISGGADNVEVDNADFITGASEFTIESWINVHDFSTWDQLFTKRVDNYNRVSVELAGSAIYFEVCNGSNTYGYTNVAVSKDEWHHYAFVYNGNGASNNERMQVYIDGNPVQLNFNATLPTTTPDNSVPFSLGSPDANPSFEFTETRLWSRALSPEEISNTIDIQLSGNENGLEYYFRTDGDGDVIANYSMNNNYGATIINYNASNRNDSYLDWMIYSCESSKWNVSDISTGIKEGAPDYNLRVAPNPSRGNFYYSFSLPSQDNVIINIFDMEGKLLFQRKYYNITSVKDFVNMSFPSTGTYILSLQQNENKQTKMFVIQ